MTLALFTTEKASSKTSKGLLDLENQLHGLQ